LLAGWHEAWPRKEGSYSEEIGGKGAENMFAAHVRSGFEGPADQINGAVASPMRALVVGSHEKPVATLAIDSGRRAVRNNSKTGKSFRSAPDWEVGRREKHRLHCW